MSDDDFDNLLRDTKNGDREATQRFLTIFESEVRTMVRHRLPKRLRTQFDSMDFVQQVWASFFSDLRERPRDFESRDHLKRFLAGVARNKVYEEHRRRTTTAKFQIDREEPLYVRKGGQEIVRELVAPDATPSQHAQASERYRLLTAGRSPQEVEVIRLRRLGWKIEEIATETQINERTVRRILEAARARAGEGR